MFSTGQKVACIDAQFAPWVYDLYTALPVKDGIYTVRAVKPGRSNPEFSVDDEARLTMTHADFDILILLEELVNPNDPHSSIEQELGFKAERFAPLTETQEEAEFAEVVGGTAVVCK